MKRIAITGISGYIGGRLVSRLMEMDDVEEIIGVDVKASQYSSPKLKFYCQDISQPLGEIFVKHEIDTAVNLAFVLKPTHEKKTAHQTDVGGVSNFLDACRQAQVQHILYLSSHTVYGAHPDNALFLGEDSPLRPLRDFQYSWDKVQVEQILRDFSASNENVYISILRSCPVIGPNGAGSVVTSMFTPIMIRVAGYDPPIQFVHEDDLTEVMVNFLSQRKAGIFNVAGDGEIRYSEVAELSRKKVIALPGILLYIVMGLSWKLRLQSESPTSGLGFIKYPPVVSTEKIKNELGFRFNYSSRDALLSFLSTT
ncbi:NAD-dependent epimerase/dehydratase family protein [Chloroflexota bacterium]